VWIKVCHNEALNKESIMTSKTPQNPEYEQLIKELGKQLAGKPLGEALAPGSDSSLAQLIGSVVQAALEQEMTEHLGYERGQRADAPRPNTRNGAYPKTLRTSQGPIEVQVPRDRHAQFEPHIVTKGQAISEELEQRIFAMLENGFSTRQITEQLEEIYHTQLSATSISNLAKKLDELLVQWRCRPLEQVYAIMIVDAIYLKVRGEQGVRSTAVYQVCAYDDRGRLEVLGVYIPKDGATEESARFWHSIFVDLQNRGVADVLYLCMDGLSCLPQAAQAIWPQVSIQPCIVHLVRNSLRHVSSKRRHEMAKELRHIYQAPNYEAAQMRLDALTQKWGAEHQVSQQWERNLPQIESLFEVGPALRKKISTTNAIENLHSHQRRYLKAHKSYPNRESALRRVTLVARKLSRKNTSAQRQRGGWLSVVNELHILFDDRLLPHWGYIS